MEKNQYYTIARTYKEKQMLMVKNNEDIHLGILTKPERNSRILLFGPPPPKKLKY